MKKTTFYKGHRWTNEELKLLMKMWVDEEPIEEIAKALNVNRWAPMKQVVRLRANGIPLPRRKKGHIAGRYNTPWTQSEIEYLFLRRQEKATIESIASDLGRTINGITGMIQALQREGADVPMYGNGVRKLWDVNTLKASFLDKGATSNLTPTQN